MSEEIKFSLFEEVDLPEEFKQGFVSSVSKQMIGRKCIVSRIGSRLSTRGKEVMIEIEFLPPTQRHKSFKKVFPQDDLIRYLNKSV